MRRLLLPLALLLTAGATAAPAGEGEVVVVRATRLHLADGRTLADAVVVVKDGRVAALGSGLPVPRGARVFQAPVAAPGFADLRTGLASGHDAEEPRPFAASLRMVDGFDPADPAAAAAAREGVLRRLLLPSDRVILGGFAAVLRPGGPGGRFVAVVEEAGGSLSVAPDAARRERHPGSLAGILRALDASFHGTAGAPAGPFRGPDPGLGMTEGDRAALSSLAGGAKPTFLHARSRVEVRAVLELAAGHALRPVLVGPRCSAPDLLEAAAAAGVKPADLVVVLTLDPDDPLHLLSAPGALSRAGVRVAFGSGGPARGPDALRLMAALARRHGLGREEARAALLGAGLPFLGRSAAGLGEGDPADLVLLDGDPADPASRILRVLAGGVPLEKPGGAR